MMTPAELIHALEFPIPDELEAAGHGELAKAAREAAKHIYEEPVMDCGWDHPVFRRYPLIKAAIMAWFANGSPKLSGIKLWISPRVEQGRTVGGEITGDIEIIMAAVGMAISPTSTIIRENIIDRIDPTYIINSLDAIHERIVSEIKNSKRATVETLLAPFQHYRFFTSRNIP